MARIWTDDEYEITDGIYVDGLKREARGDDVSREEIIDACMAKIADRSEAAITMHLNDLTFARDKLGMPTLSAFGKGLEDAPQKLFEFLEARYADAGETASGEPDTVDDGPADNEAEEAARSERRVWTDEEYEATDAIYASAVTREQRGEIIAADDIVEQCRQATGRIEGGSVPMHLGNLTFARAELGLPTLNAFGNGLQNAPQKLVDFLGAKYALAEPDVSPSDEPAAAPVAPSVPAFSSEAGPTPEAEALPEKEGPPASAATQSDSGPSPASTSPLVWIAIAVATIVAIAIIASLFLTL